VSKTALYVFLAITCVGLYVETHFTLNQSASEPVGLYRPTHEPLNRGALVLLKMPLKRIAAVPGDRVTFGADGVSVNGKLMPHSAPEAGLPHFPFGSYTVPADMFLGLAEHPDSWDGRYQGFLPLSIVSSTAQPIWTEK
jgi:type IV secretory pathway protease TraF